MPSSIVLSDNGASSGSAGLKQTAGNDGVLILQTTTSGGTATSAIYVDTSQNVGLGVTPSAWTVAGNMEFGSKGTIAGSSSLTSNGLFISANAYYGSGGWTYKGTAVASQYLVGSGAHYWYTAPSGTAGNAITWTQAMTLDASGNLGVGVTSVGQRLEIGGSNDVYAKISSSTNTGYRGLIMGINGNSDIFGSIAMEVNNGQLKIASGYSGWGGFTTFYTNGTEKARIDTSGNLLVGATSFNSGGISKTLVINGASSSAVQFQLNGSLASYVYAYASAGFRCETSSTYAKVEFSPGGSGGVQLASAGATSWTSLSDERTKTDLTPITNAAAKVSSLRAVTGRFKTDSEETRRAFLIAQDVQNVLPEAVSEYSIKDDDTNYLGLSYTDTIPLLVAAIKEQQAIIEQLKARLDAANL